MTTAPLVNQPALGELIERRREELGLTKSAAARDAGVSRGTWHEVETGKRTNMLASTLNLFDKALGYERGTLRRLSRGEPRPSETAPQTPVFVSYSLAEDPETMALRMQFIRLAMTMARDDLNTVMLLVSARETDNPDLPLIEQLARQVRALTFQESSGEQPRDIESGRATAGRTRTREPSST